MYLQPLAADGDEEDDEHEEANRRHAARCFERP